MIFINIFPVSDYVVFGSMKDSEYIEQPVLQAKIVLDRLERRNFHIRIQVFPDNFFKFFDHSTIPFCFDITTTSAGA